MIYHIGIGNTINHFGTRNHQPLESVSRSVDDIVLKKKPEAWLLDPGYLAKFAGKYQLVDQTVTVSLKGNALTALIAGQPEVELVPDLGREFYFKQARTVSIRFIVDAQGVVTAAEFIQADEIGSKAVEFLAPTCSSTSLAA